MQWARTAADRAALAQRVRDLLARPLTADAALNLVRAEQAPRAMRERLTRLLGLWGAQTAFTLPQRLPDLPKAPDDQPDIERLAMAQRLDVAGAKLAVQQTAKNLGLTTATRFINVPDLGLLDTRSNHAPTQRGWEISLELPLFDWGGARVARAEAVSMQAVDRAAQMMALIGTPSLATAAGPALAAGDAAGAGR